MLEIKIRCDCGQKYSFDVEPLNGRMPYAVECPICRLDGTAKANDRLSEVLSQLPAGTTLVAAPAAAVPVMAGAAPAPVIAPAAPQVRIKLAASAPASPVVVAAPPPLPGAPPPRALPGQVPAAAPVAKPKPSFGMGVLGAITGALVGSLIYFSVFHFFGARLKLLALLVGYLAGLGAELMGRKEGSKELGVLAATFCLIGVVGAQYCVVKLWWNSDSITSAPASYEAAVEQAQRVVAAVPTGSDQEIRVFLAAEYSDEEEKVEPSDITAEDIQEFKETELPGFRDLAGGEISQQQYDKEHADEMAEAAEEQKDSESTFKAAFLLLLLSKFNLFSMAAAAGLAFKVCSNA